MNGSFPSQLLELQNWVSTMSSKFRWNSLVSSLCDTLKIALYYFSLMYYNYLIQCLHMGPHFLFIMPAYLVASPYSQWHVVLGLGHGGGIPGGGEPQVANTTVKENGRGLWWGPWSQGLGPEKPQDTVVEVAAGWSPLRTSEQTPHVERGAFWPRAAQPWI